MLRTVYHFATPICSALRVGYRDRFSSEVSTIKCLLRPRRALLSDWNVFVRDRIEQLDSLPNNLGRYRVAAVGPFTAIGF